MNGEKKFKVAFVLYIILGNILMHLFNVVDFTFDPTIYWLPEYALKNNFLANVWHLHTNPPLLNILYGIVTKVGLSFYTFCSIAFPLLQIVATLLFYQSLITKEVKHAKLFTVLFFANPLHFIWFNFYYYPAIIFFSSALVVFILFSKQDINRKLLLLSLIFVIISILRASYHPVWIALLILSFRKKVKTSTLLIALSFLLIPILWYTKNYSQYGFWGGSSLFGQNISAHYKDHLRHEINNLNSRGRYKLVNNYRGLYNEKDLIIQKYSTDKLLNDTNTLHNVRTILISQGYQKETEKYFNWKYSALTIAYGTFSFFGSPVIDEYNNKSEKPFTWNNSFLIDWFDLPNIKIHSSNGGYSFIRLSWYTIFYPLTILFLLYNYRSLSFEIKFLLHWMLIVGIIYCTIDPNEAARMRYETEPVFYFMLALIWGSASEGISKK